MKLFAAAFSFLALASLGAQTTVLKVGTLPYVSSSVLKIAADEGYFKEQGIEVQFVPFRTSTDVIAPLIKGDLDAASPSLTPGLFNAIAQGAEIRMAWPLNTSTVAADTSNAFVVRKADFLSGKYTAAAAWKGARVVLAGARLNAQGYSLSRLLQTGGLTFKDVTISTIDLAVQAEALATGQVDIVLVGEPWLSRLLARPDLALLRAVEPITPNLTLSTVLFGSRLLKDPALGVHFKAALLKATRQYLQGKTPRNVKLIAEFTGLDEETVTQIRWSDTSPTGKIDTASVLEYQNWLKDQGALDRVLSPDEFLLKN